MTLLGAALLLIAGALPVLAHAALVGTSPPDGAVLEKAPSAVVLRFNEPVSPLAASLILPGGKASEIDLPASADSEVSLELPPGLGTGTHVLSWRAVSGDGHPVAGTTVFSIGVVQAGAATSLTAASHPEVAPLLWSVRIVLFVGLFFGAGGAAFRSLSPVLPAAARRFSMAATVAGIAAATLVIGLQGLDVTGGGLLGLTSTGVWQAGLSTVYGQTSLVALLALVVSVFGLNARSAAVAGPAGVVAILLVGLAVCLSGHASAAHPQWLMKPALFVHMVCIAWWIGALLPLILLLRQRHADAVRPLVRFSHAIPYAIVPLVVSGCILAVVQMGWPGPAWLSGYGLILGAKLSLLVVLFAIASWNRWVLTAPAVAGEPRAIRHMRRGIGAEIILILLIFGLVSGWRFTPPPRALAEVSETQSASLHLMGDDVEANVTVSPATVGTSRLSATLTGEGGEALGAKSVRFVLTPSSGEVAPTTRPAALTPAGTWEASDVVLPLAGLWTVQVEVRVTDFQLVKLHGEIEVAP